MNQTDLTKTSMVISNEKKTSVSMANIKYFSALRVKMIELIVIEARGIKLLDVYFHNKHIFRHLKFEISITIPASNDKNRNKPFSSVSKVTAAKLKIQCIDMTI